MYHEKCPAWTIGCPAALRTMPGHVPPASGIKKGARRKRAPFAVLHSISLLLRITLLGRVIPCAARLVATGLVRRRRSVLSEGRASEGECQGQCERRNERFHETLLPCC